MTCIVLQLRPPPLHHTARVALVHLRFNNLRQLVRAFWAKLSVQNVNAGDLFG